VRGGAKSCCAAPRFLLYAFSLMAFAVVDCDNFYVSCERVFAPRLRGRPVVVLSNNDGCVISRSQEAKRAGVRMGVPLFEVRALVEAHGVEVFSSNYELYGDISGRVMEAVDRINRLMGRDTVRCARVGFAHAWRARCGRRSPHYTTDWRELLTVAA